MPTLDEMRGVSQEDMQNQHEQQKQQEQQSAQPQEQQKSEETKKQNAKQLFSDGQSESEDAEVNQPEQSEDADDERQRNINTLRNQFGTDLEDIPENFREEALKMAKSYRHAQGKFTNATQERSELQQKLEQKDSVLNKYNTFLDQNPDVKRTIQQRLNGENPQTDTEPQGQPNSLQQQGQLTEQQLVQAGYLNQNELQGLDDLARREAIVEARLDYKADQKAKQYQQKLEQAEQDVQQKKTKQRVKQVNAKRKDDGIDRFVSDYGVDLTQLDDDTIKAVSRRATRILDPTDETGRLIDQDAYYDALRKELAIRGKLPQGQQPQQASMSQLQNTGASVNKRPPNQTPTTAQELMEQKEQERTASLRNTHPRVAS